MMNHLSLSLFMQLSFYFATLAFLSQRQHFLMSLLCLEGVMLTLVLYVPSMMYMTNMTLPTISIILLTFGACEASLGLSILVFMSRSYGSDMLNSMTTNKC